VNKEVIDPLLTAMVQSGPGVSDLLFAVGKPPIVEEHGSLEEFPIDTPGGVLAPLDIEEIGLHLMRGESRLLEDLKKFGSCDCSYALADVARFRVNIFKQNGRQAIVMRKLRRRSRRSRASGCRRSSARW
jgi:twitching motility protein PilT